MAEQMFHREIPICRVSVDGNPLAPEKQAALTRVTVDLDGDLFGQCSLHFNDPRLELIDGKEFGCGADHRFLWSAQRYAFTSRARQITKNDDLPHG